MDSTYDCGGLGRAYQSYSTVSGDECITVVFVRFIASEQLLSKLCALHIRSAHWLLALTMDCVYSTTFYVLCLGLRVSGCSARSTVGAARPACCLRFGLQMLARTDGYAVWR